MPRRDDINKILILGSGPIVIEGGGHDLPGFAGASYLNSVADFILESVSPDRRADAGS